MGEARDIIAREISGWLFEADAHADLILAALTAAGWTLAPPGSRVVPEGGVDAETVAKAMAADIFTRSSNLPEMRDEYVELVYPTMMPLAKAALRALAEAKP